MEIYEIIERLYNSDSLMKYEDMYGENEKMFDSLDGEKNPFNKINNFFSEVINNYPPNKCEYVDKYVTERLQSNALVSNAEKYDKTSVIKAFLDNRGFIEKTKDNRAEGVKYFNNSCERAINNSVSSGYVNNIVDNSLENVKKDDFINNFDPVTENINNLQKLCSEEKRYISEYGNENHTSSSSSSVNINLGGITQNITNGNGDDVLELLVDKLLNSLNTGGDCYRY